MEAKSSLRALAALFFAFCTVLSAQEARGLLQGRVTDSSGAVITGATVRAQNVNTGVTSTAQTNDSGDYLLPFLNPGTYTITADMTGFKRFARDGIDVKVSDRISIDIGLEIGSQSETVRVDAQAPLLDTSTTSMGMVVDSRRVLEMPIKDGSVATMAILAPGVMNLSGQSGYTRPFDTNAPSQVSIDGTRTNSNQFTMDGAPNMQRNQVAYSPPPGVVDEFKVQGASFDAATGYSGGAQLSMSLKSGTNSFHGQMYEFLQNPKLNANKFLSNRAGLPKPTFRMNRWGTNLSGPVVIPKFYNGRNRTFWMYGYEGADSFDPLNTITTTVPTAAQRNGDFSALLALGPQYQIYDPDTIQPAANGRYSRQPFPNNIIPASRINPTGRQLAALWDEPNLPGTADFRNNFTRQADAKDRYYNHIFKIDENVGSNHRFFVRGNITEMARDQNIRFNNAVGDQFFRWNKALAFDDVHVFSPTFVMNARYSYTRFVEGNTPLQQGWDLAGLGFSPDYIARIQQVEPRALKLPNIQTAGYADLASQAYNYRHDDIHDFGVNLTYLRGTHTMRFGTGFRAWRENTTNLGQSSGQFIFGTDWTRGPLDSSAGSPIGQGLASLLLGLPSDGSFPIQATAAEQATTWASYFQDDWKVTPKLTLSLGLRYERTGGLTERFNRSVRGFDSTSSNPIEAQVRANYETNPIADIDPSAFRVRGGLTFAGVDGQPRSLWATNNTYMPRIGFAYSMTPKIIVRGGYGIYFEPIGVVNTHVNQAGFSRATTMVPSLDNGQTFIANISNPFPGGFLQPLGAAQGLETNLGQTVNFFQSDLRNPYMQRWQFAVQRELPADAVVEVSYVGNRGTRLRAARQHNAIPAQYLSTSSERDQRTIDYLAAAVPNPFYPLLPKTALAATTVARSQLLRPYPQFTSVIGDTNQGYSWYHSMQTRVEKRFSHDYTVSFSWTWSKMMEAITFLNEVDPRPEEVISDLDRTHRFVVNGLWELPFGKGKALGGSAPPVISTIVSGWQFQGIYQWQSGPPLGFGNAIFRGDMRDVALPSDQRSVDRWFNVDAGFERLAARQLASNIRTLSSRFSSVRGDGLDNWDLSIIKNTNLSETVRLQFRTELINAFNHAQFGAPDTNPASTAFGQVTSEWAWPRVIQFGLKLVF